MEPKGKYLKIKKIKSSNIFSKLLWTFKKSVGAQAITEKILLHPQSLFWTKMALNKVCKYREQRKLSIKLVIW